MALTNLGTFYREAGRLAEAVSVAEEAVERYRVLAGGNPGHLPGLAMALTNLGTFFREAGRLAEAVSVAEEAVERYRVLAGGNPAHLPSVAMALTNLGTCYQATGRAGETEEIWEDCLGQLATAAQITLLFHRALGQAAAAAAVNDLQRASSLVEAGDPALTAELHDVARSCRANGPADFDNAWQRAVGEIPAWLVLDPDFLETVTEWCTTPTYSEACSYAIEHAIELLHGETGLALDELDLRAGDISATAHEHQILAAARESDFEKVYRPYVAGELVDGYLASDFNTQAQYLRDHEGEIIGNEEFEIALGQFGDEENPSHRSGIAVIQLAKSCLLEQALAAIGDQDQFAALVSQAALGNDATPVRALGWLMLATSTDEHAVASALFCAAIAAVLSAQTEVGADQLRNARRVHAATVQGLVPTLLQLTAIHPELAVLAPVLGESLPDANDEMGM
jgi:tetratricopeptide (TPR) repeat protein